ncbi:putative Holin-X, holin superfamily III [Frankia sp. EI5c]|uniref:phage holin family protein n=1 Tax=Frankia sp. EI5c TaxID=683316 RepID=UPI0007C2D236|nr:phage holin family protein [Frankia sp. EI5c]OAA26659.1 putative Holin-X, holin superfamily III [Frankia sp. EI5c]
MTSTLARQPTTPTTAPDTPTADTPRPHPPTVDRTGVPADAEILVHTHDGRAATSTAAPGSTVTGQDSAGALRPDSDSRQRGASTGHLVAEVATDVSTLFRQEIALAKAELREEATKAGKGAGMFAGAGGAGFFALVFLLLAFMFGLSSVMALGWAALIVGVLLAAAAGALALLGRRTVRTVHPAPTRTVETLREDIQWAQNRRR